MQIQLPNPRDFRDGRWSSQPNTRPRFSNLGQNCYGNNQIVAPGQNYFVAGQNNSASGQNVCADGYNVFQEQSARPNVGLHGWPRPSSERREFRLPNHGPHGVGPPDGLNGSFGPTNIGPNAPLGPTNPILNHVQLDSSKPTGNVAVPWRTKPRARVFSASNPCFGLLRLGDLHAFDYSDPSVLGSHINSAQYRVSGDGSDSLVPGSIGTSSWYPDSGASNHVCRDSSALHNVVPYSGTSSILISDGTPAMISSVGQGVLPTRSRLLRLSNVLCVPAIRKNLLSVSQFATDNGVFFEFHSTYCVIKDNVTQEILMTGRIHYGLYQFSLLDDYVPLMCHPSAAQVECSTQNADSEVFSLWHKRLGHPSSNVVKNVLHKCHFHMNKISISDVCTACKKGKFHKLPFLVPLLNTLILSRWLYRMYGDLLQLPLITIGTMCHLST
ncbi:hypothetical protein V6Z11_D05G319800 [Gossypium hirsutum]